MGAFPVTKGPSVPVTNLWFYVCSTAALWGFEKLVRGRGCLADAAGEVAQGWFGPVLTAEGALSAH